MLDSLDPSDPTILQIEEPYSPNSAERQPSSGSGIEKEEREKGIQDGQAKADNYGNLCRRVYRRVCPTEDLRPCAVDKMSA